jgi:3-hydroxyisobutyrate dehydrogenase
MAERLFDSGDLRAFWNRSPSRASKLVDRGMAMAASPAAMAAGAKIVCLCLSDAKAVRAMLFAADGIIAGVKRADAPLVVDFSTSSPLEARELAGDYKRAVGGRWLDAPVSGGAGKAATGRLSFGTSRLRPSCASASTAMISPSFWAISP